MSYKRLSMICNTISCSIFFSEFSDKNCKRQCNFDECYTDNGNR